MRQKTNLKTMLRAGIAVLLATMMPAAFISGCAGLPQELGDALTESLEGSLAETSVTPSLSPYQTEADLSNVDNAGRFYLSDEEKEKLAKNNFVVSFGQYSEFFDLYEDNRYMEYPSFITTDSMMHTYHLFFSMLQENTERDFLSTRLKDLSAHMLEQSLKQAEDLKGTAFEEAAEKNTAYFAIASALIDPKSDVDAKLSKNAAAIKDEELSKIQAADGISPSLITGTNEDYTQYKPRGYYAGNELLENYFRAMMFFGRTNFAQSDETMNRCALLITLAMDQEAVKEWEAIYKTTAFFAGESDDLLYTEYTDAITEAYGAVPSAEELKQNADAFDSYTKAIALLRAPAVNSVVFMDDGGETDKTEAAKGFRFMGQRFTLDASIFTKLCYSSVKEAPDGDKRMLPDALDVPAALGSDAALNILIDDGNDKYPNYMDHMEELRNGLGDLDDYWSSSLSAGWLDALRPLLEVKGEGYPSFMTNSEWQKKNLEGFLASWTELKHDTVLYSKQFMAEMGGGDEEVVDDRGYVEPEAALYDRLYNLTLRTLEGLTAYDLIGENDKANLERLSELAKNLRDISVKELQGETLSFSEYEMIRGYGGSLEHFWEEAVKNHLENGSTDPREYPLALVTDVATDPNGSCLEEGVGGASRIYVVFPIEDKLQLGIGAVFNYYQFIQPISDRLTDEEWRIMTGMALNEDMEYDPDKNLKQPAWTDSYRYKWTYEE